MAEGRWVKVAPPNNWVSATYDINYRSERPGGRRDASQYIQLRYPSGAKLDVHLDSVTRQQRQLWDVKQSALKQQRDVTDFIGKAGIAALQPLSITRAPITQPARISTPSTPAAPPSRPPVTNSSSQSTKAQSATKAGATPIPPPREPIKPPSQSPGRAPRGEVDPGDTKIAAINDQRHWRLTPGQTRWIGSACRGPLERHLRTA